MKRIPLLLVFTLLFFSVRSQTGLHRLGLENKYGWIIPHNPELREIASSNPLSLGITSQWMKTSLKNWESCFCFHYLGINLSLTDFQNPRELGQAWSLSGSFEPILYHKGPWSFTLSTGLGLSYLSRVYDPVENPNNTFFSAPISFLLNLSPKLSFDFSENWSAQASLDYQHISNGGQRQPNRGMNFPMVGLGLFHYIQKERLPEYMKSPIPNRWYFYADLGFNTRESGENRRRPNFLVSGGAYRKISGIVGWGAGAELAKDFSIAVRESRVEALIPGVYVENHLLFGRFDFSQRLVAYLYKPEGYREENSYFQRYTLHYRTGEHLRLGVGMKAHGHVAEYLDLRLGLVF